jgi:hypothetical protein
VEGVTLPHGLPRSPLSHPVLDDALRLMSIGRLTLDEWRAILHAFYAAAPNIEAYQMESRPFGEQWAQADVQRAVPALRKPDPKVDTEHAVLSYDLVYPLVVPNPRVEVKACRAVVSAPRGDKSPLWTRAAVSAGREGYALHFSHVKCAYADVIVLIGVWLDVTRFWVLSSSAIRAHPLFIARQQRDAVGNGQLGWNQEREHEMRPLEVARADLEAAIRSAGRVTASGTTAPELGESVGLSTLPLFPAV